MGGKIGIYDASGFTYVPGQIGAYVKSGILYGKGDEFQSVIYPSLDHLNIYDPVIKPIKPTARFLGFEGEDIMIAEVLVTKVFDKNLLNANRINEHLKYNSYGHHAITYCRNYADVGDKQFGLYYRHGKWDFIDYLPDAQIVATTIKRKDIEAAIKKDNPGENVFIDRVVIGIPDDKDWVRFQLQELYGYQIAKDLVTFPPDTNYYKLESFTFNATTGKFDVVLANYSHIVQEYEYYYEREPCIFRAPPDLWCYNARIFKRPYGGKVYDKTTHKYLGLGGVQSDEWIMVQDFQHMVGENQWLPYDQIINSFEYEMEPLDIKPVKKYVSVPAYGPGLYYDVHYRTDIDDVKFWINPVKDSDHPDISSPISSITEFDMYPIVTLRSNYTFITNYDDSEERVNQSKELLSHIGVDMDQMIDSIGQNDGIGDVKDVFFGIGVSPSNNDWSVSAALYESLNWIFSELPPSSSTDSLAQSKYGVSFQERPFNSTVFFKYRSSTYHDGRWHVDWKDYDLWESEYSHSISKVNVTIKEVHLVRAVKYHELETEGVSSVYTVIVCGGKKYYEYEYSDDPGKIYSEYAGELETKVCTCDVYDDFPSAGCENPCKKYELWIPDYTNNNGWWGCETIPETRVVVNTRRDTTYVMTVVFQIHRNRYHKIMVSDVMQSYIIQDRGETSVKNFYPTDEKFVFPVSVEVVGKLTLMEKNALLGESAYLFFYAVKWQHLEWYETGAFQGFLGFLGFAITVTITIVSMGSMSFVGMTALQALTKVLTTIIIPVALNLSLKLIDSIVQDPFLKAVLSVGVSVLGLLAGNFMAGGFSFQSLDIGSAVKLAQLPMKAIDVYNGALLKQDMEQLQSQQKAFSSEYGLRMEEFSSAMQSLGAGIDTGFLANLSYDQASTGTMQAYLVQPDDYYAMAFANDVPAMCSRETFCQLTVDNFCKNSLALG